MDLKVQALNLGVDPRALQLADSLPAARAARAGQVAADRAVLARGVAGLACFDGDEIGLFLFFEALLLDHFAQVEVPLQLAFFLYPLDDPFLVFELPGLAVLFEHIVVVEFSHLIWILVEVVFQVHQFVLGHGFAL